MTKDPFEDITLDMAQMERIGGSFVIHKFSSEPTGEAAEGDPIEDSWIWRFGGGERKKAARRMIARVVYALRTCSAVSPADSEPAICALQALLDGESLPTIEKKAKLRHEGRGRPKKTEAETAQAKLDQALCQSVHRAKQAGLSNRAAYDRALEENESLNQDERGKRIKQRDAVRKTWYRVRTAFTWHQAVVDYYGDQPGWKDSLIVHSSREFLGMETGPAPFPIDHLGWPLPHRKS